MSVRYIWQKTSISGKVISLIRYLKERMNPFYKKNTNKFIEEILPLSTLILSLSSKWEIILNSTSSLSLQMGDSSKLKATNKIVS